MSRSGYHDDMDDNWSAICWRGAVASAIRGKRGQTFLKEMLAALDAMPEKKLVANELELTRTHELGADISVCAIGAVGLARNLDMSGINPECTEHVADTFGIAEALAREIVFMNDEGSFRPETDEQRWSRMRAWVENQIHGER
jgi:hypothetical protein